jgi:hypothetical protein
MSTRIYIYIYMEGIKRYHHSGAFGGLVRQVREDGARLDCCVQSPRFRFRQELRTNLEIVENSSLITASVGQSAIDAVCRYVIELLFSTISTFY